MSETFDQQPEGLCTACSTEYCAKHLPDRTSPARQLLDRIIDRLAAIVESDTPRADIDELLDEIEAENG